VAALARPEYAARVAQLIRTQEIMHEKTAVLKIVPQAPKGTVYCATHELDDPLTMRILAELTEHTGEIPRQR
jgi:hypothetical protein